MTGLSPRNLKYMRAFAEAYPNPEIVQQVAAQLPWGHHMKLLDAVKDPDERYWYGLQAGEYGWSRNVLAHQIETGLYHRQDKALTNFTRTLMWQQGFQQKGRGSKDGYRDNIDAHKPQQPPTEARPLGIYITVSDNVHPVQLFHEKPNKQKHYRQQ
jgi:predicted nuclease of restriction endonuclease-like (RecB) superfamily